MTSILRWRMTIQATSTTNDKDRDEEKGTHCARARDLTRSNNGRKDRTSDGYGREESSGTGDGESMDLTGEREDGDSCRGDSRAWRVAREAETWAMERFGIVL